MTLQSSGAISIQNLATEYGGNVPHSMSEYYRNISPNADGAWVPLSIEGFFEYGWTSTGQNLSSGAAPINVYFRRIIYQTIYTAAELTAAGVPSGAFFNQIIWNITEAVPSNNSILGMNIRLFHTPAANGSTTAVPVTGTSKVTVYSDLSTTEFTLVETTGDKAINFGGGSSGTSSSSFQWDGVNNVCVESCTSQNQTNYAASGRQRVVSGVASGGRNSRTDSAGNSCNEAPSTSLSYKVSTRMRWSLPVNQNVPVYFGTGAAPSLSLSMFYNGRRS
jgi:hypothetical protein